MKYILGTKLDMTQIWKEGEAVAVTRVKAGPCVVVQVKNQKTDGYDAIQFGFGDKKEKNINKPQRGHLKGLGNIRHLRELRLEEKEAAVLAVKKGDVVKADTFTEGDKVKVIAASKGKGFQGVVKRHGFHGQKKTHGNKDQERMPGSVGATGPAHVFKGTRMGGRTGGEQTTIANLKIVSVENDIILIHGAVPGPRNGLIIISGEGELKIAQEEVKEAEEPKETEAAAETTEVENSEEKTAAAEPASEELKPESEAEAVDDNNQVKTENPEAGEATEQKAE